MIFADKLIQLRKQAGWSQEELANEMNVTRQSVSKWEGAQSIPDMEKMLHLSELFHVSMDYLLKDDIESMETNILVEDSSPVRKVSMEEANAFMEVKQQTATPVAIGTFLCIISPICLLILGALSQEGKYGISENAAGAIGMIVLLCLVAIAVVLFIQTSKKLDDYAYLEKEIFETEYGVSGMVKDHKAKYKDTYTRNNTIGTVLCILAATPLLVGAFLFESDDFKLMMMLCVTLLTVAVACLFFIISGTRWSSYDTLLQEGDYTKNAKKSQSITSTISVSYWLIATAVFLAYSLSTNDWDHSWIIFAVAGVLFAVVMIVTRLLYSRNK